MRSIAASPAAGPAGALAAGPTIDAAWLIPVLALLCATSLLVLLWMTLQTGRRQWQRTRRDLPALPRGRLPSWMRLPLPVAEFIAGPLGPLLAPALREQVYVLLRQAEVEEEIQPQQFVALGLLHVVAGVLIAAVLWSTSPLGVVIGVALVLLPWIWLRDASRRREWEILRDLPIYVDMLTLALEAGGALSVALRAATERMPDSPLRRGFSRVQNDLRAGRSRADALRALAQRVDAAPVTSLVAALVQAEGMGGSLSNVLRAQSEQRLNERFARAEKLALEAPVKLLAPLILCIFPCTFLVLAFPIVIRLLEG